MSMSPRLLEIGGGKRVAEIAEMADDEVVEADREDRVPSPFGPFSSSWKAADTGDEHLVDLVLSRTAQDHRLAADGPEAGVTGVFVRHGHEAASVLGMACPDLGSGGSVSTTLLARAFENKRVRARSCP